MYVALIKLRSQFSKNLFICLFAHSDSDLISWYEFSSQFNGTSRATYGKIQEVYQREGMRSYGRKQWHRAGETKLRLKRARRGKRSEGDWRQRWSICHFLLLFPQSFWWREKMYKKDCAISLPTGFIFEHCRLVSQCNAPPITSHSFAPTPHPSRPSAHAPSTLWRQSLLRTGGGIWFCHPQSTSYPPSLPPSPPPHVFAGFLLLASSLPRSLLFFLFFFFSISCEKLWCIRKLLQ